MTDNLSPTVLELRRAFAEITAWCEPTLPMPVINTPGKDRRRKGWSWYTPDSWNSQTSDVLNALAGSRESIESKSEVCLAAEALGFTSVRILTELTHQAVHHYNYVKHIKDTSCGILYDGNPIPHPKTIEGWHHNRSFRVAAYTFGLLDPRKDETTGEWSFTLSDALRDTFAGITLDPIAFDLDRRDTLDYHPGSRQVLWECGCKHPFKIRAARNLTNAVKCLNCDTMFKRRDG